MKIVKASMLVTALVLFMGLPASGAQGKRGQGPCREDVERLCKDVKGRTAVRACLKEHTNELSDACKSRMQTAAERRQACKADAEKLCSGKKGKQIRRCLKQHESELSDACRVQFAKKGSKAPAAKP